jgi:hypothetical protein
VVGSTRQQFKLVTGQSDPSDCSMTLLLDISIQNLFPIINRTGEYGYTNQPNQLEAVFTGKLLYDQLNIHKPMKGVEPVSGGW